MSVLDRFRLDGRVAVIGELKRQHPTIPIVAISGLFESGLGMSAEVFVALGAARAELAAHE